MLRFARFQLIFDAAQQDHVRAEYVLGRSPQIGKNCTLPLWRCGESVFSFLLRTMLIRAEGCEEDVDTGVNFVLMAAEDELQDFRCQDERNWETISAVWETAFPTSRLLPQCLT